MTMVPPLSAEDVAVGVGLDEASRALAGSCAEAHGEKHSASVSRTACENPFSSEEEMRYMAFVVLVCMLLRQVAKRIGLFSYGAT
jgi:hypothetical protein